MDRYPAVGYNKRQPKPENSEVRKQETAQMNQPYESQPDALEQIFRGPIRWVNLMIIVINILIFAVTELLGSTEDPVWMLRCGAAYVPLMEAGQWYRLITSMFLHFGIAHLFNNMFLLLFMGDLLESLVGKWRYLVVYFGSGLAGNLLSFFLEKSQGDYSVSAGASGAIFGVIGGVLVMMVVSRGKAGNISVRRLGFMILLTIYYGFQSSGINNAAHIGGILGGALLMFLLYPRKRRQLPPGGRPQGS